MSERKRTRTAVSLRINFIVLGIKNTHREGIKRVVHIALLLPLFYRSYTSFFLFSLLSFCFSSRCRSCLVFMCWGFVSVYPGAACCFNRDLSDLMGLLAEWWQQCPPDGGFSQPPSVLFTRVLFCRRGNAGVFMAHMQGHSHLMWLCCLI